MSAPRGRFIEVEPGRRLYVEQSGDGTPTLFLHGFTGSLESLRTCAESLGPELQRVMVDVVGHGRSDAPLDRSAYSMRRCVEDLVQVQDCLGLERLHVIGYSMGARIALSFAVRHPSRVRSLVLIGGRAGVRDPAERRARIAEDEELASQIFERGLEWFVEEWMARPIFASQARLGAEALRRSREQRLQNCTHGLALSLLGMGAGAQPPLFEALPQLEVPVLLVVGAEDERFEPITRDLGARLPRARITRIPHAGHAAHLENPVAFASLTRQFLSQVSGAAQLGGPMEDLGWKTRHRYRDIRFETLPGIAKITLSRPEVRNAFRPRTVFELIEAFGRAREDPEIGVVLLRGEGEEAFCAGGDQRIRGDAGYVGDDGVPRLNALDLQRVIRSHPKPVIALVAGYAIGGGHVLHLLCDLTLAASNARFGQTGPRVGSFDAGFGTGFLARVVGQKKAREIWFLCEQYDAQEALQMGLVNAVVPVKDLEATGIAWARRILRHSPTAIRCLKAAFNADCDGLAGIQELAGQATQLFYMTEEAQEGRDAFVEKRSPDFSRFPWRP